MKPVLILLAAVALALAPLAGCTNEQLNSPAGQAAAASATNIATDVLNAWIASHPFSSARGAKAPKLSDPAVAESMAKAEAKVLRLHPELTPGQAKKVVRDVYAAKIRSD